MSVTPPSFPLFKLPQKALGTVLRSMELPQLLKLSWISARTKTLIKSQNLRAVKMTVALFNDFVVELSFGERADQKLECLFRDVTINPKRTFSDQLASLIVNKKSDTNSPKQWVYGFCKHLRSIFTWKSSELQICPLGEEHVRRIHETFGDFDILKNYCLNRLTIHVLDTFKHARSVCLDSNPYDQLGLQKMLAQNLNSLVLGNAENHIWPPFKVCLDDLLTANTRSLTIIKATITDKELNKFFRIWQKTRSNPRMEYMRITLVREEDFEASQILNGIEFTECPESERRLVGSSEIYGGFDIRNTNGTVGTILFDTKESDANPFQLMVSVIFVIWT